MNQQNVEQLWLQAVLQMFSMADVLLKDSAVRAIVRSHPGNMMRVMGKRGVDPELETEQLMDVISSQWLTELRRMVDRLAQSSGNEQLREFAEIIGYVHAYHPLNS